MTDREAKAFYNAAAWKHKRMQILERDHYECQDCRKRLQEAKEKDVRLPAMDAKIRRATQVHHIMELKEHPELALDDEFQSTLPRGERLQFYLKFTLCF